MDSPAGDFADRFPVLFGRSCGGFRIYRDDGFMFDSDAGNQARDPKSKYRSSYYRRMEFYTGGSLFCKVALALSSDFYSISISGWISEVAEPLIAPGLGLGSLGIGSPFSDSP
jgi:hypothetical protein